MSLDELYKLKGEAQTQIEVWSAKLNWANQEIVKRINTKKDSKKPRPKP